MSRQAIRLPQDSASAQSADDRPDSTVGNAVVRAILAHL
jgi:hypothetical protein